MKRLVRHALKQAQQSDHPFKVGAVAFRGGAIVSRGRNQTKTRPLRMRHKPAIDKHHAEMECLRGADLEGCTVLVVRLDRRTHTPTMARPCPDCMERLRLAGVRKVWYSDFDGKLVKENI